MGCPWLACYAAIYHESGSCRYRRGRVWYHPSNSLPPDQAASRADIPQGWGPSNPRGSRRHPTVAWTPTEGVARQRHVTSDRGASRMMGLSGPGRELSCQTEKLPTTEGVLPETGRFFHRSDSKPATQIFGSEMREPSKIVSLQETTTRAKVTT